MFTPVVFRSVYCYVHIVLHCPHNNQQLGYTFIDFTVSFHCSFHHDYLEQ